MQVKVFLVRIQKSWKLDQLFTLIYYFRATVNTISRIFGFFHITWKINSKWEGISGCLNESIEEFK
jgi:hypothetical protein